MAAFDGWDQALSHKKKKTCGQKVRVLRTFSFGWPKTCSLHLHLHLQLQLNLHAAAAAAFTQRTNRSDCIRHSAQWAIHNVRL